MKRYLVSLCIIGFVIFSFASTFYELWRAGDVHTNREFELVHNFPTDYNFYLSRIREGLEGRQTVVEKYTSEPHNGSLIHEMYLLMGRVGRIARVPTHRPGDIYHVARAVLAITLLVLIAEFCKSAFLHMRGVVVPALSGFPGYWTMLAFLLAVTASSWPKLVAVVNTSVVPATTANILHWRLGGYMAWWSVMDSLQRITFIPHILAGQALIIALIVLLTNSAVVKISTNVLFIGLLAFVLGMIFPPGLLFVYAVMGIWLVFSGKRWNQWIVPYGAVVMMSIASIGYFGLMTGVDPWKRLVDVDIIRPLPFKYLEYFKAVGPVLPLGALGLILALRRKEKSLYPAVVWVVAWAMLLGVFAFIPQQSPLRFSEMIPHVPLGALTAYLFFTIRHVRGVRHFVRIAALVLVGIGLFHMYSSYLWQKDFIDHKIRATLPLVPTGSFVMYPLKDFMSAMRYMQDVLPTHAVILSETTAGNYIPVVSGLVAYAGHDNTVAFEEKKAQIKAFFSGRMHSERARNWVQETRAQMIFFGPQEREDGGFTELTSVYPFLEEVYRNTHVIVYSIQ